MTHSLSRRNLLKGALLGAGAVTIAPILGMRRAYGSPGGGGTPGKFMVVVNLIGGNDSLNMVAPIGLPSYVSRRPQINLVTNLPVGQTLHPLFGNHALHYRLAGIKQMWDDGDVHIVGKVSYPSPNQSHFTSRDIYSYGIRAYEQDGDGRGWLGRFADCYWSTPSSEPLGVISVGLAKQPDFRADITAPLIMSDVPSFNVIADSSYAQDHLLREQGVRNILTTEATPAANPARLLFTTNRDTYPLVDRVQGDTAGWVDPGTYGTSTIGRNMRAISQLLHARSLWGTQVFYTGYGGFDTHSGQHSGTGGQNVHDGLFLNLDTALTAFANDLKARGMWDDCVIVVITEFGRRTYQNGSTGTDHGHGTISLVAGGAVRGSLVSTGYTAEVIETDLQQDVLPFQVDFRDLYSSIIQDHLGLDPVPLFPDPSYVPNPGTVDVV